MVIMVVPKFLFLNSATLWSPAVTCWYSANIDLTKIKEKIHNGHGCMDGGRWISGSTIDLSS